MNTLGSLDILDEGERHRVLHIEDKLEKTETSVNIKVVLKRSDVKIFRSSLVYSM